MTSKDLFKNFFCASVDVFQCCNKMLQYDLIRPVYHSLLNVPPLFMSTIGRTFYSLPVLARTKCEDELRAWAGVIERSAAAKLLGQFTQLKHG